MKATSRPARSGSTAEIVVLESGHRATAPASALTPAQVKFERILVPIDFSEHSLKAFRTALEFAQQFDAELILVHVIEQFIYPGDWTYPPVATSDFAAEKRTEIAAHLKALAAGSHLRTTEIVRIGRAWQEIVEIAKEYKPDLLIVATHGYTGLRHVLLGSVAEKVVRHAPCPVLTVRAEERAFL
jgi:universal stress protein A